MITIIDGISLDAPAITLAFGMSWCSVIDTTAQATHIVVSAGGVTEQRSFYNGIARFSIMPFARQRMDIDADLFAIATSKFAFSVSINVKVYNGDTLLGETTQSLPMIYGSADTRTMYIGERWITYNPAVTESAFTMMVDGQATMQMATLQKTINQKGVMQNEQISKYVLASDGKRVTIFANDASGVESGNRVSGRMTLHITKDERTENIVNVRWIDIEGKVNYRTFAAGTASQSVGTASEYKTPQYNRVLEYNTDKNHIYGNKELTHSISFGDDAIEMEQYEWLCSLLSAGIVEVQDGGHWTRVALRDSEMSVDTKKHLFSVSCVAVLPKREAQVW